MYIFYKSLIISSQLTKIWKKLLMLYYFFFVFTQVNLYFIFKKPMIQAFSYRRHPRRPL